MSQTIDDLYTEAKLQVRCYPALWRHREIILSDAFCSDEDHLRWVITAPPDEVEAWAKQIAR